MANKETKLDNGRTLQPGATPLGTAAYGEVGLFGERWYDNNGDKVDDPTGSPCEKYSKQHRGDK